RAQEAADPLQAMKPIERSSYCCRARRTFRDFRSERGGGMFMIGNANPTVRVSTEVNVMQRHRFKQTISLKDRLASFAKRPARKLYVSSPGQNETTCLRRRGRLTSQLIWRIGLTRPDCSHRSKARP